MVSSISKANEIIDQQQLQIEALTRKLQASHQNISMLQHQVEQLLRRIYGRRSERLDPNQLMFDSLMLNALEQPVLPQPPVDLPVSQEPKTKPRQTTKRQHPGRIPIPEHLERVEIVLDIPEKDKVCPETGEPLKRIGWEVSEKLEYRPGKLIVNVYKRPKYAPSDIGGCKQRKGDKEFLHFLGAQELGRLLFGKATKSHEQRSQVFLHHPALPMQVPQESSKTIPMDVACSPRDPLLCQEVIEVFNLQLGQGNAMLFKIVMERGQNPFHLSEGVGRNPVGLLAEIGIKGIGQIDQPSWDGQRFGDLAAAVKKTGECGERARSMLETAHVAECLEGVEGEHLFPGHVFACCEAKELDQDEGVPGDGAMGSIGL
jgi:Transposase C of IS166 homeodomain/zinc-finger binding domain of transposase IS66